MAGDTTALRLCLERIIPSIKAQSEPTNILDLAGSLTEQGEAVITAMGQGKISPEEAASMLQALAVQARITEADELKQRISNLEERYGVG